MTCLQKIGLPNLFRRRPSNASGENKKRRTVAALALQQF
jgi:hypothetical protein